MHCFSLFFPALLGSESQDFYLLEVGKSGFNPELTCCLLFSSAGRTSFTVLSTNTPPIIRKQRLSGSTPLSASMTVLQINRGNMILFQANSFISSIRNPGRHGFYLMIEVLSRGFRHAPLAYVGSCWFSAITSKFWGDKTGSFLACYKWSRIHGTKISGR